MRRIHVVLGVLTLILCTAQTLRHGYVRWVEPRISVLDRFQEQTEQDIAASKSLQELVTLYEVAHKKLEDHEKIVDEYEEKISSEDELTKRRYGQPRLEPYKTRDRLSSDDHELRQAIQTWEEHSKKVRELHFFWWSGAILAVLGAAVFRRLEPWLGFALVVVGFLEMFWATCPSSPTFGWPVEFDRLLNWKLAYSTGSLVLLLLGWWQAVRVVRDMPGV